MAPRELYSLRLCDSSEQTEDVEKSIELVVQCLKCFIWCSGSDGGSDSKQSEMTHKVASKMNRYNYSMEKENSCYDLLSRLCDTVDFVKDLHSFLTLPSAHLRTVILKRLW